MSEKSSLPFHDWLVGLRRYFHQYPELAYREEKTAEKIARVLGELGIGCKTGIGGTGILASLAASRAGPTLAIRADMDALPIEEKNDLPYRSKNAGVMHACGHDGHIAIALGTARSLVERKWAENGRGKVLFIFQPAEESGAGARAMLDSGAFDSESVDAVFAGHMHPQIPAGQIGIAPDVSNAASDNFVIKIVGKGGHGAHPHLGIDPIVAGSHLVTQIQTIIGRSVSPLDSAVVTVGKFHSGSARNIIPEEAVLEGTVRTLRPEVRERVLRRLKDLVEGIASGHGVSCDFSVMAGYPLLRNDPKLVDYAMRTGAGVFGAGNMHSEGPRLGAEDFAYFALRWPGVLVRIGCRAPGAEVSRGLHSPWFDFDESALDAGVRLFTALIENYRDEPAR
ncbi:MAG: M20 family metallopeptidase [Syntrophobacteraceae bacterium]